MDDITVRLRALSRHEHDDLSIGDEAADYIAALRAENERLQKLIFPNYPVGIRS